MIKTNNIWFAADFHYGHSNICYGVSRWKDKEYSTRKFDTLEKMNSKIIENINNCVKQEDELYFLGDWSFGGIENIYIFWDKLICKNIYFVPGNHDHHIKKNKFLKEIIYAQELFTMLPELCTITINKQQFVLSHYPIEEWENMQTGTIHLHGHSHHKLDQSELNQIYRRMDVGIDWAEFRPFNLTEILEIMNKRENKKHGS